MDAIVPRGGFFGPYKSFNALFADQLAIPAGPTRNFWVPWVEKIDWRGHPIYYRAAIAALPVPPTSPINSDPYRPLPLPFNAWYAQFQDTPGQSMFFNVMGPAGLRGYITAGPFLNTGIEIRGGPLWNGGAVLVAPTLVQFGFFNLAVATNLIVRMFSGVGGGPTQLNVLVG